jgi:hypothetical protein
MSATPTQIAGVTVRANQNAGQQLERPTPGSVERSITPEEAARLPIDAGDLMALALLAPGVVEITASDTSAAAISVGGLRTDANNVTLDGLTFGTSQVPQEAVRQTRVITSSYDVTRGQFSGGQISSTTRSGSNRPQGNFNYSLRDDELSFEDEETAAVSQPYTQNQLSGGFGGPIVKDQLFWFGSLQLRRRTDVTPSLANADALTLGRLGVSPDTVARFFDLASAAGIAPFGVTVDDRTSDNYSTMLRLDWLMPSGHSIMVRGDYRWSGQDPTRISTLSLPQTGGTSSRWGGGIMGVLTSNFGGRFINELKLYGSTDRSESNAFIGLPAGRVQVSSALSDGARGISTLSFGGNTGLPQDGTSESFEATNELSWLTDDGAHRFKLGALFNSSRFEQDATSNRNGTFTYLSLADFESGRPSMFTRTLTPRIRDGGGFNAAVYLGDTWRATRDLQLTYGVRAERSWFGDVPDYNPEIEQAFGFRTDRLPADFALSPRVGFTWTIRSPRAGRGGGAGGGGPAPLIVRGGLGTFRSGFRSNLSSSARAATGLLGSESQLVCIGEAVPVPDWTLFGGAPSAIPTECLDGGNAFVPEASSNVAVFADDFQSPRAWRGSLGVQRRLRDRYQLTIDFSYSRGLSQMSTRDLNLATTPRFQLGSESGRPVFVDAASIVPQTGATSLAFSRVDPEFGHVMLVGSDMESRSKQLTFSLNGFSRFGALLSFSYTLASARDQASSSGFTNFSGTTAGDPNVFEWAPSDFDRRHSFRSTLTWPFGQGFELTAMGRMSSGAPFTPRVGGDINGDGARNDRAFLFDPGTTADTAVANGMRRVLATAPGSVRECLTTQLGKVAERNSCRGVWRPSLELQLNWRPNVLGLERRLSISLVTQNFLSGLDELLHGQKKMRGWGSFRGEDETLLYVRGFDPASNAFLYQVNERFGASRNGQNGIRVPFQIGIQARYSLGPDRMRDFIQGLRGGGGGPGGGRGGQGAGRGDGGGPGGPLRALMGEGGGAGAAFGMGAALNPVAAVIALEDSIGLTPEQVTRLQPIADSLQQRADSLGAEVRKVMQDAGANPDMSVLMRQMRPKLDELRRGNAQVMQRVQEMLTAAQWAKVPERLKRTEGRGPRSE